MNIPVVIVDNAEADRYIARRRFSRAEGFGECVEYTSGLDFIQDFSAANTNSPRDPTTPTVVLMDISMPGKNGFQVIDEYVSSIGKKPDAPNLIFVMYTSSDAMLDREQAASMPQVSGYVQKPLRSEDVLHIRELAG